MAPWHDCSLCDDNALLFAPLLLFETSVFSFLGSISVNFRMKIIRNFPNKNERKETKSKFIQMLKSLTIKNRETKRKKG